MLPGKACAVTSVAARMKIGVRRMVGDMSSRQDVTSCVFLQEPSGGRMLMLVVILSASR